MNHVPLLSPKQFADFSPPEFHAYVKSLYREPERKEPSPYSAYLNKKGTLVLRVSRKPKLLLTKEVDQIALAVGWKKQQTWLAIRQKGIEVKRSLEPVVTKSGTVRKPGNVDKAKG